VRRAPSVSRLATFTLPVGWHACACGALTCAYVPERDGYRPGVRLKVAVCDTKLVEWAGGLKVRAWVGVGGG